MRNIEFVDSLNMTPKHPIQPPVDLTPFAVTMLGAPLFFLEFIFIGLPMLLLQGVVLALAGSIYDIIPLLGREEFEYHKVTNLEDLNLGLLLLLLPLALSFAITVLEFVFKRKITATLKHRFVPIAVFDTIVYGLLLIFLLVYGLLAEPGGMTVALAILSVYAATLVLTYLHFWIKEKIHQKVLAKLVQKARTEQGV